MLEEVGHWGGALKFKRPMPHTLSLLPVYQDVELSVTFPSPLCASILLTMMMID